MRTHRGAGHLHGSCDPEALAAARSALACVPARLGIVTTFRNVPAVQLAYWLDYHMRLGVRYFVLYAEDAAESERLQRAMPRCAATVVWRRSLPQRFEPRILGRQDANINDAIAGCMQSHCDAAVRRRPL
jgi:hypothetical protein